MIERHFCQFCGKETDMLVVIKDDEKHFVCKTCKISPATFRLLCYECGRKTSFARLKENPRELTCLKCFNSVFLPDRQKEENSAS